MFEKVANCFAAKTCNIVICDVLISDALGSCSIVHDVLTSIITFELERLLVCYNLLIVVSTKAVSSILLRVCVEIVLVTWMG